MARQRKNMLLVVETLNGTQAKASSPPLLGWRVARRAVTLLLAAFAIGCVLHFVIPVVQRSGQPAGFVRGLLHGALMPCALPNLLVGNDVTIYAQNNTGLTYKLGYTTGVNACGALFFGLFFWRVNRWRKRGNGQAAKMS
jgi:hypothetical protein